MECKKINKKDMKKRIRTWRDQHGHVAQGLECKLNCQLYIIDTEGYRTFLSIKANIENGLLPALI